MDVADAMGIVPRVGHFLGHPYIYGPIIIAFVAWIFMREIRRRNPEIRGSALMGMARVLSVKQKGANESSLALRIELRVEIPGRQPYDVAVERTVDLIHVPRVQPGATIPVQIDAANPQRVRIDFNQPIT
jgi:hypothetical protein